MILCPSPRCSERGGVLPTQRADAGETFSEKFERALLLQFSGDHDSARADFQWCYEHLTEASLLQILALAQTVNSEPDLAVGLRIKLAKVAHVKRAWEIVRNDETMYPLFQRYLALLPKFPVETCEFLLTLEHSGWRLRALKALLDYGAASGVETVVRWLQIGQLDVDDAIGLLESFLRLEYAAQTKERSALLNCKSQASLDHPAVLRVLEQLGRRHPVWLPPVLIRPGDWIHTAAGWGRIEQIENAAGEVQTSFRPHEARFKLQVALRVQVPARAERVEVNLIESAIYFVAANELYTCIKCRCFVTQRQDNLHEHNRFDPRPGYGRGISPCRNGPLKFSTSPSYAYIPPGNPWE